MSYLLVLAKKTWIQALAIFVVSVAIFSYIEFSGVGFLDFDPMYHFTMADMMAKQGPIIDFPWLRYTVFNENFVDHHLLFHVAQIPFVISFGKILGGKISIVILASIFHVAFYLVLRKLKIRYAFWWTVILMGASDGYVFRMNLGRAQSLSLAVLFAGLATAWRNRPRLLVLIAYIYALLFDGFVILGFMLAPLIAVRMGEALIVYIRARRAREKTHKLRSVFAPLLLGVSYAGGVFLGIVINPYFPKNLSFLYTHLVRIGSQANKNTIGVGAEWYPYKLNDLLHNTNLVLILLVAAAFCILVVLDVKLFGLLKKYRVTGDSIALMVFSVLFSGLFFFILTQAKRFIEYFIPVGIFTAAVAFDLLVQKVFGGTLIPKKKIFLTLTIPVVLIALAFCGTFMWDNIQTNARYLKSAKPADRYVGAGEWLIANTPEGSVVTNVDWDDFPNLFYADRHNVYIAGLDPIYSADFSRKIFDDWAHISSESDPERIRDVVQNELNSRYIFIDSDHRAIERVLKGSTIFKEVYRDQYSRIFEIQ